jgi:hypothetical protein
VRLRVKWDVVAASAVVLVGLILSGASQVTHAQAQRAAVAPKATSAEAWQIFAGPDGDFTVSLPGRPSRAADAQGPVTTIRFYELLTDRMHFVVNFQGLGGDPKSRVSNEYAAGYEALLSDSLREQGQRVVRMRRVARNMVDVEAWQTPKETGAEQHYLSRYVIRRGRTYQLNCASRVGGQEVDRAVCRRFFSSLRFSR